MFTYYWFLYHYIQSKPHYCSLSSLVTLFSPGHMLFLHFLHNVSGTGGVWCTAWLLCCYVPRLYYNYFQTLQEVTKNKDFMLHWSDTWDFQKDKKDSNWKALNTFLYVGHSVWLLKTPLRTVRRNCSAMPSHFKRPAEIKDEISSCE